ncbi:MAG TPA: hypothetical protein VJB89_04115 [Candidatus Nanoarchaeia archaeon]|nr:hypothetical protein [Candidatus Nanoarchaeia archaeon]
MKATQKLKKKAKETEIKIKIKARITSKKIKNTVQRIDHKKIALRAAFLLLLPLGIIISSAYLIWNYLLKK